MKKKLLLPVLAILSVMLVACGGQSGPEQTIDNFMKDYKDLKLQELKKYVDEGVSGEVDETETIDLEELSKADFSKVEKFDDLKANFKKLTKEVKYDVTNVKEDGATATADITFTYADASEPLTSSFGELIGQIFDLAFSGQEMTEEEMELKTMEIMVDVFSDSLDGYEATTKEVQGKIELVEKEGEWIITDIDEEIMNALTFGLIKGLDDFDPFGMGSSTDLEFEENPEFDFEFDFEDEVQHEEFEPNHKDEE